jgi:hypothetical protein
LMDWAPPPRPCRASSTGPRGLRIITVPRERFRPRFILLRASIRLQSLTSQCLPPVVSDWVVPSMRFCASSRHQHPGSAVTMGSRPPPPSALRFSQPLGGLHPETPCGLVPSRWHVQASPFRGFPSPGAATTRRRSHAFLPLPRALLPLRGAPHEARLQGLALPESPLRTTRG